MQVKAKRPYEKGLQRFVWWLRTVFFIRIENDRNPIISVTSHKKNARFQMDSSMHSAIRKAMNVNEEPDYKGDKMLILEKSYNAATTVPIESKLFETGHIFIENEITSASADAIKKQIMYLVCASENKPIYIHINSSGGDINAGLVLYDIIQDYANRIYLVCTGRACSMAAILLACGKKGRRFMLQNSEAMIHEPLISNQISGNCSSIKATSMRLVGMKEKMNRMLAKHTGKSLQEIDEATSFDNYLNAQEAVALGLVDKILSFKDVMDGKIDE